MSSLALCRTCLTFSSKMHNLRNTQLQETFEKLTNKRMSEGALVCYICYAMLQRYHRFADMSWKSEMILGELSDKGIKITQEIITRIGRRPLYSVTPIDYFYNGLEDTSEVKNGPENNDKDFQIVVKVENIEIEESEVQKHLNSEIIGIPLKQEPFIDEIIIKEELEDLWLEEDIDVEGEVTLGCESIVKSEDIVLEEEYVNIEHTDGKENIILPSSNNIKKESQTQNSTEKLKTQTKKAYTCDICSKTFKSKSNIKRHMTVHSQDKVHICRLCDKGFRQKRYLKEHIRVHTREKPFICHICGYPFTDKSSMNRHSNIHANKNKTDKKTFACNTCNKKFLRRCHLKEHMRVHTGSKPYKCSVCKHSFSQIGSLTGHMRIHTGEKTHYCSKCNKGFYRKGHLHQHMSVHTKERPFKCTHCGKWYTTERNLIHHSCKLKTNPPL